MNRHLVWLIGALVAPLLFLGGAQAQVTTLSPVPVQHFVDNNGIALSGGKVFTYIAGTTTKLSTYTDGKGTTPNTNPIILNARGEAQIWLTPGLLYKFVLSPASDTDPPSNPIWTVDAIAGSSSPLNAGLFCGNTDGVADNTTCFQAAVTAGCASTAGVLTQPSGKWKYHDITVPCEGLHIVGASYGNGGRNAFGDQAGTWVDCSGMVSNCIKFAPADYPLGHGLRGGSVEKIGFSGGGAGAGYVVNFTQVTGCYARDLSFWSPPNAILVNAANGCVLSNIQSWENTGNLIEITGNLNGKNNALTQPCTANIGDCLTRTDFITLDHVTGENAPTGTSVYIHDQVFTVNMNDVGVEGGTYGLKVRCAGGVAVGLTGCPQQIEAKNFQTEFSLHPYDLQDFTWFKCVHCYGAGITGAVPFSGASFTQNVVTAGLANYPIIAGGGGGIMIQDSQFFGSSGSCLFFNVTDTKVSGSDIVGCSGDNNIPTHAGIEYNAGSQHRASDNSLCSSVNAGPFNMNGYQINNGATNVLLDNNSYLNCYRNVVNNSSVLFSVYESNPVPPNSNIFPVTISGTSGLGSSGTVVGSGNDLGGTILLTAGTGAAASGGPITITFGQPQYPSSICNLQQVAGSSTWDPAATISGIVASPTQYLFNWRNGSTPLANGFAYFITYRCKGF